MSIKTGQVYCIAEDFKQLREQLNARCFELDMVVRDMRNQTELGVPIKNLRQCGQVMKEKSRNCYEFESTLSQICQLYENNERKLIGINVVPIKGGPISYPNAVPCPESSNSILQFINNLLNGTTEDEDILQWLKTWLGLSDNKEAGTLKKVISYLESFKKFFTGDKKGFTGASNWCSLTKSSVSMWSGLYDYFANMYKGMKEFNAGFFGKNAQKNVKVLELAGGFFGLLSSFLSANDKFNEKEWQDKVADYIDCGKDIVSIYDAKYALDHINDTKSLINCKAGPWNALSLYEAVINSGIGVVSQAVRSYKKYFEDGKWSIEDTGAAGVDISMAGLYEIGHKLSFGLDDIIYKLIDAANGKIGESDLSYYEQAAEGWKILGKELGNYLGRLLNGK